jgi:hypothetical protein
LGRGDGFKTNHLFALFMQGAKPVDIVQGSNPQNAKNIRNPSVIEYKIGDTETSFLKSIFEKSLNPINPIKTQPKCRTKNL